MSIYSKTLSGQNSKLFVSPVIEYTDDTTYGAFVANAVDGEIGVFLDTLAVRTTALTAGLKFFVAQKRGGNINKTPMIEWDRLRSKLRTAYTAPVNQVTTIGYNATSGDVSFNFTGASLTSAQTYGIAVRDLTPGNQPFPVQEGYTAIVSTTADEYTALADIVSQLNGDYDFERTQPDRFVKAEILSDGAPTAFGQTLAVTNGSKNATAGAAVTFAANTKLKLAGVVYNLAVAVSAGTAIVLDRPYQGPTATLASGTSSAQAASMAYTSGTNLLGVRLTTLSVETVVSVQGTGSLYTSPITKITNWLLGSGSGASIVEWEKNEAPFFDGIGSTRNAAFAADYGQPTLFAASATTYDLFFLNFTPSLVPSAATPLTASGGDERISIAAPTGGTTPGNELQTIFGL